MAVSGSTSSFLAVLSLGAFGLFSLTTAACSSDASTDGSTEAQPDGGGAGTTGGSSTTGGGSGTTGGASTTGGGTSTTGGGATSGGSDAAAACAPVAPPACDAVPMDPGPARPWHGSAPFGSANHRGRDLFLNPTTPQIILAKFAYGAAILEAGIKGEDVDVYLLRDCGSSWEKLGTATTTNTAGHAAVEGVTDEAGRIFFEIPTAKKLGLGRHRVRLVVAGDLSATELFIEVVPPNMPMFVSDVDGTLTTSETAQFTSLFTGTIPDANVDAAQALSLLAEKGYRPMYITARPEWLVQKTREWIASKGFPPGIIHTTLGGTGATGTAATTFKSDDLANLATKSLKPTYVFGNTNTDADAYDNAGINPLDHRVFFQYTDTAHNGRRIEAYTSLLPEFGALSNVCP